ncbi:hypothetical protein LO772_28590 [Yinghuangia sp. ASG 101]|uniref:hypothetical protein n=1 Tax=Yinghuangia sp. ASG 101 TaxID=2896848 RepID=UPI001E4CCFD7|nr:hypothetical protein [Yinghuangia sp. ASG 101]UGQ10747.1 hypothetical protein LO772_28590 [Yinghuangia sp. ASG 101]
MIGAKTAAGTGTTRRPGHAPAHPRIPPIPPPGRDDGRTPPAPRVPGPGPECADGFPVGPGGAPEAHGAADPTRPRRTRPRVRLRLPDGQHLDVTLVSWHQYADGTWRARVSWTQWGAVVHAGEIQTRSCAQQAYVPARVLSPLPGEDYRAVRRHRPRITAPRQP